jgi:ATP-dependent DNA helicase RecG
VSSTEDRSAHDVPRGRSLAQLASLDVDVLKGVSDKRRSALESWGVHSVLDLLWRYPRRYIDRTRQADLKDLAVGDEAVVLGTVTKVASRRTRNRRAMVEVDVDDGTGSMRVVFFNQAWRAKQLAVGSEALFFGKLDEYRGTPQMTNPIVDVLVGMEGRIQGTAKTGRIIPVYPQSAKVGLTSWMLSTFVAEALERAGTFADPLDQATLDELDLVDRTSAMRWIHAPESLDEVEPARRRLAFDELLRLQLALVMRRRVLELESSGIAHQVQRSELDEGVLGGSLIARFIAGLPFSLTGAQRRVLAEIIDDLASPLPMHRLVQGDVGSGKTVVAIVAMLASVQSGLQAALMAPTEVLAEQHFAAMRAMLADLEVPDDARLGGARPLSVALLTSSTPAKERRAILEALADGSLDLVVGTHALLTDEVVFAGLGVAVVDEQHRFGVEQRAALKEKGVVEGGIHADPDLLVMTATPIPRTAAMVVFGDLEMSLLDEMPEGRSPIETHWARSDLEANAAWARVRSEVAQGRQAYVVCPLVEGSERIVASSATEEAARLAAHELKELRVGLLHGQMKPAEKDAVMDAFRTQELDVLVATTVIEVGVDVPNATVMVIEDADRFGIAQLHQLRGRVGRGSAQSYCYLLSSADSLEATTRLDAMESTTDGFVLAEIDLELRGQGTILGSRQKGRSDLALASLARDRDLLDAARQVAEALTEGDPRLEAKPALADELKVTLDEEDATFLFKG